MKIILKATLIMLLVVLVVPLNLAYSRDLSEIEEDIQSTEEELDALSSELKSKENELAKANASKNNSKSEIERVRAEVESGEMQIELLELEYEQLEKNYNLQLLQKEEEEKKQEIQLGALYMSWKENDKIVSVLMKSEDDPLKANYYQEIIAETDQEGLNATYERLRQMEQELDDLGESKDKLARELEEKRQLIATLEEQIKIYEQVAAQASSSASGLRAQIGSNQSQRDALVAEKEQLEAEIDSGTVGGQQPLVSGQVYFSGSVINPPGDPSYDAFGHGLGLSQFGAYGAANAGWSADQIVTFYYRDTQVRTSPGKNISVQGHGTMTVEDYVSGLGEVPDRACGTLDQITSWEAYANEQGWSISDPRRDKYVIDNPSTIWDCWPEEAIKAQVLAARSYGITSSQPICTTAACQVYKGGKAKAWAAWETEDKYIFSTGSTHNGQIIRAFYSSYNNNGAGTADNVTVWGSNSGTGTQYSYLRSVNDNSITYKYLGRSNFRTNSYSMAELNIMTDWCVSNCYTKSWFNSAVKSKIGTLTALSTEEDGSGRVKKVILRGDKGNASVSGRYFRTLFNKWINASNSGVNRPSDNLKGITFKALTVE
ncbi:hypothetical protein GF389_03465 [Candidatus Dojkabacteria bacterium]|nr:hypothetical protein [Candidatus Dojkabacteria bacterium]